MLMQLGIRVHRSFICLFIFNPCEPFREHLNQESTAEFIWNERQNLVPGDFVLQPVFTY